MGGGPAPETEGASGATADREPPAYADVIARDEMVYKLPENYRTQSPNSDALEQQQQQQQQQQQREAAEAVVDAQFRQLGNEELPLTIAEASDVARQAADAESCGLRDVAHERYEEAASALRNLAKVTRDANERAALEMQAGEYEEHGKALLKAPTQQPVQQPVVNGAGNSGASARNPEVDRFTDSDIKTGAQLMGTGMGAGVGALIGIPLLGGAAGFFTANHFVDKESEHGARTRELGLLGARMLHSARGWNDQYKWSDRARESAGQLWTSTKELNEKHDLTGKAERAASQATTAVLDFNREHRVTERVTNFATDQLGRLVDGDASKSDAAKVNPAVEDVGGQAKQP